MLQPAPVPPAREAAPPPASAPVPAAQTTDVPDDSGAPAYNIAPEAFVPTPRLAHTGVSIDHYDARRAEGDRSPDDEAYAAVVRGGAAIAQERQGPLDGAWTLVAADGGRLYDFQLVDSGHSLAAEGAWRAVDAARRSGFMLVGREAGRTTLRFFEPGGSSPILVELEPMIDGSWRGRLLRAGTATPVTMRRR
jgi:hypothetical protein